MSFWVGMVVIGMVLEELFKIAREIKIGMEERKIQDGIYEEEEDELYDFF